MPTEEKTLEDTVSLYLGGSLIIGFLIMLLIDQIFSIIKDKYGDCESESDSEPNDLKESLLRRTSCKHVQNSKQSTRIKGCVRIMRCASVKPTIPRMLSVDYTDEKLIGKVSPSIFKTRLGTHT